MNNLSKTELPNFTANVGMPLIVDDADNAHWDESTDILVVGFGGAGAVAALQARELDASVIAIDRFIGGGATANSGGVVYAGGTDIQRGAGFEDSADEMFKYLSYEGTPVKDETLRRFCDTSRENIEWLTGHGVEFESSLYSERIAYPPDGYHLYYTGMEKFRADVAKPAPRGHRTVGKGASGKNYFAPLKQAALKARVRVLTHTPARRLVMDQRGQVIGVEAQVIPERDRAKHESLYRKVDPMKPFNSAKAEGLIEQADALEAEAPQKTILIRAKRGVILSSGGYNYNLKLYGRYRPEVAAAAPVLVRGGGMGCDGSGIELGISAGGDVDCMDTVFISKAISPPNDYVRGILVNLKGERLLNEDAYLGNVGNKIIEQDNGVAWVVLEGRTFWRGVRQLLWPIKNAFSWWGMPALMNLLFGGTRRASSLDALAQKLGMDAVGLKNTVADYNALAKSGQDTQFGKQPESLAPIEQGPYYAINLSLKNKYGFSGSMPYGGLTVNEETGAVTRPNGSSISGLYAAGRSAVGICSGANFSGLSIADTIFSGRRAVRAALADVESESEREARATDYPKQSAAI
ncbi:MAG: FAD-binding protein [Pseudomonadota bacterium]